MTTATTKKRRGRPPKPKAFELSQLAEVLNGEVLSEDFTRRVEDARNDILSRPGVRKARTITLKINMTPRVFERDQTTGDKIATGITLDSSIPPTVLSTGIMENVTSGLLFTNVEEEPEPEAKPEETGGDGADGANGEGGGDGSVVGSIGTTSG